MHCFSGGMNAMCGSADSKGCVVGNSGVGTKWHEFKIAVYAPPCHFASQIMMMVNITL